MAEPLKNSFGPDVPKWIAESLGKVDPTFNATAFLTDALRGYEDLELTPRARHIADCLADHLPTDRARAVDLIVDSLGPANPDQELTGMEGFRYLPYVYFVAEYGLDTYEESMRAQCELTKRFSAEFSIRAFITKYPTLTMDRLATWAQDSNVHVRRLVSEGTRPRLPWASRLPQFQADPAPVPFESIPEAQTQSLQTVGRTPLGRQQSERHIQGPPTGRRRPSSKMVAEFRRQPPPIAPPRAPNSGEAR